MVLTIFNLKGFWRESFWRESRSFYSEKITRDTIYFDGSKLKKAGSARFELLYNYFR